MASGHMSEHTLYRQIRKGRNVRQLRYLSFLFQLSKLSESGNDRLECANVDLKADIERWHKNKRTDFRDLLTEYSERHVNYYEEVSASSLDKKVYLKMSGL